MARRCLGGFISFFSEISVPDQWQNQGEAQEKESYNPSRKSQAGYAAPLIRSLPLRVLYRCVSSWENMNMDQKSEHPGARSHTIFRLGDTVRVVSGPFVSFTGKIEGINQTKMLLKVKIAI